ncbi:BSD domain-containing protein 1 isoform X3 [Petromyzon marinus]|uniref:BSD domain-containing protein 1 isoform X3 n=1 Tax=Petromyzon marinus TaxID=7757 RepID=UPI003F7035B3
MADGGEAGGGWWGSWIHSTLETARSKSSEALEFIKRDLTEFTEVVQHDTTSTIAATASAMRDKLAADGSTDTGRKMKESLSSLFGVISDAFSPSPDRTLDCDEVALVATPDGSTEPYDRVKARLYSLQADPATYCNEPDGLQEHFMSWAESFSLEERKAETAELLVACPAIRALYTRLVPAAVSHLEFWHRYFYKVYQLEQDEARRADLMKRADPSSQDKELGWEDEEGESADDLLDSKKESRVGHVRPSHPEADGTRHEPPSADAPHPPSSPAQTLSELTETALSSSGPPARHDSDKPTPSSPAADSRADAGAAPDALPPSASSETVTSSDTVTAETLVSRAAAAGDGGAGERRDSASPTPPPAAGKDEAVTDLRVLELRSDSGKSTPSNSAKIGSSTDISEDWEKEFELDMTEEEIQQALAKAEASGEMEGDWEDWE